MLKKKGWVGFDIEPEEQAGFIERSWKAVWKNNNMAKLKRYWYLPDPLRMFTGRSGEFSLDYNGDEID